MEVTGSDGSVCVLGVTVCVSKQTTVSSLFLLVYLSACVTSVRPVCLSALGLRLLHHRAERSQATEAQTALHYTNVCQPGAQSHLNV